MRKMDGHDIQYHLRKKGYNLSDVGRALKVTPQAVSQVVWGVDTSQRIVSHIEWLLGMKPETLCILKVKRPVIRKKAA